MRHKTSSCGYTRASVVLRKLTSTTVTLKPWEHYPEYLCSFCMPSIQRWLLLTSYIIKAPHFMAQLLDCLVFHLAKCSLCCSTSLQSCWKISFHSLFLQTLPITKLSNFCFSWPELSTTLLHHLTVLCGGIWFPFQISTITLAFFSIPLIFFYDPCEYAKRFCGVHAFTHCASFLLCRNSVTTL